MKNSGRTILIILFALLLLSPLDPVPDVIPVVGWTDLTMDISFVKVISFRLILL